LKSAGKNKTKKLIKNWNFYAKMLCNSKKTTVDSRYIKFSLNGNIRIFNSL